MDEKNDFQDLDKMVVGSSRNGQPVLRIGFQMQLYLRNGPDRAVRHNAARVLSEFAQAATPNIKLYQKHMSNRMSPIGGKDLAALLQAELDRIDPDIEAYGPHVSDEFVPPRWQGAALLQPANASRVDLSVLHLAIPAMLAKQDPDDLIKRLTNWCQHMQPLHGSAGLAPIYEIGMQESYPNETWPLLSRFTGLDYMNGFVLAARNVNQIRGVNWLTFLGTTMLDEIGGTDRLAERLKTATGEFDGTATDDPVVHPYDGGVVIRAGQYPQLGDRNISGVPISYQIVNAALRPWLFTAYENKPTRLIKVPRPLDAYDETMGWVTRFDRKG